MQTREEIRVGRVTTSRVRTGRRLPSPMPRLVTDQRIHTVLPVGTFEKLAGCFHYELLVKSRITGEGMPASSHSWCRFVFSLIAIGGLAGPEAWKEILGLRWRHIASAGSGYILVPRFGGEVPLFIPPVIRLCALSHCRHLMRAQEKNGCRGSFPPDDFLPPGREKPDTPITAEEARHWKECFSIWLERLSSFCGLRISIGQLEALSRARMADIYSPSVAGHLLGLHASNPAPVSQYDAVIDFRDELDLRIISSVQLPRVRLGVRFGKRNLSVRTKKRKDGSPNMSLDFNRYLARIRRIVCRYSRTEKHLARQRQKTVKKQLHQEESIICSRLKKRPDESWPSFIERTSYSLLNIPSIVGMNAVILIKWSSRLVFAYPPNTVEARLNDVVRFFRLLPFTPIYSITTDTVSRVMDQLPIGMKSKLRMADSLRSLHAFVEKGMNLPVHRIEWWRFRKPAAIRVQPVLTQVDFLRLLSAVRREKRNSQPMMCAIVTGYYFGLRESEICHLRLCDVWLNGSPTVFVWDSKGGLSRFVQLDAIPSGMLMILRNYFGQRMALSEGDGHEPFLARDGGAAFSRQQFIRFLGRAMERGGISLEGGEKQLTAHGLRHACANRWWAMGVPLEEISRRLGHKSMDTTIQNYIHIASLLQREQMPKDPPDTQYIKSVPALAGILGLTGRGARYWLGRMGLNGRKSLERGINVGKAGCSCAEIIQCLQEELKNRLSEKEAPKAVFL